ncbi:FadR/GntR family transcriptional regulator [Nitriliruptor alkaliphilus]|uniref:FadR/GntR family transcriptional regulator n=1 Tax=Nitriliruptor alkaliphilus TaxID=427918 RepID=UPI00147008EA|nr:FadR/GntR family transcriptional regulator [Nitriliruptor alkaliphilus]
MPELRRVRIADEIASHLEQRIVAGEYTAGDRLPSLRKLAEEFGVSPLTVREATASLEAKGLVRARHGAGTYVLARGDRQVSDPWIISPDDLNDYEELVEARLYVESALVELAAKKRSDDDLETLRSIVEDMRAARQDPERFLAADYSFHVALAEAAHNRALRSAMIAIRGPLKRLMAARSAHDCERDGNLDRAITDHEAILEGIEAGRAAEARRALKRITDRAGRHIGRFRQSET